MSTTDIFKCELCSEKFSDNSKFTLHLQSHESNRNESHKNEKKTYDCDMCDKKYTAKHAQG